MATIIIINEVSNCIVKSVSMEEANYIHDLCNHFIDPDGNPDPRPSRIVCGESLLAVEIKQELEHMIATASWAIEHINRYEQGKKS